MKPTQCTPAATITPRTKLRTRCSLRHRDDTIRPPPRPRCYRPADPAPRRRVSARDARAPRDARDPLETAKSGRERRWHLRCCRRGDAMHRILNAITTEARARFVDVDRAEVRLTLFLVIERLGQTLFPD